ncbi:cystatin C (amyloid angiopathy and cerebral hemorrhage) [Syngnathoides biaculeatus]|uniref:cystatin C (amyloid angiopathy and cerebral hemorrhage) n=1 Tax=Syngnathoides biaculeatus TaxID=300417 RepID=UPI002ADDCBA6|nr:cystatin C (amyloid angiopathy and cerebral hemorrhage) [Syngnathoides biaculeatus]
MVWKVAVLLLGVCAVGLGHVIPGGFSDADSNSEDVQNALKFAIGQHNNASADLFLSQLVDVVSAKSQIVSGIRYVINVKMAKTSCRKDSSDEQCGVAVLGQPYQCTFTVWSRPWLMEFSLLEEKCSN